MTFPFASLRSCLPAMILLAMPALAEPADPFAVMEQTSATPGGALLHEPCIFSTAEHSPLSLAEVVERALCHNPQTREAWANARAQAALVGVSESAYLPSFSLNAGQNRNRIDDGAAYNQFNAALALSYVLYDFGARAANLENARQILVAANATQNAVIQSVFLSAVQAYYQMHAAGAAVESARAAEAAAQQSVQAASARHQAGVATPADRLQAQTALSQAILTRIRAEGDAAAARGRLANSMGLDAHRLPQLAAPAVATPDSRFEQDVEQLIVEARRLRPELAAAEAQLKAARASEEAARAAGKPAIALSGNLNHTDRSPGELSNGSALGVTLSAPLFSGYASSYRIRAAREQADARLAQREKVERQVALEVWLAYQALVTETQAVHSSADLLASATESERVAMGRYRAGVGNLLDLLAAQSALASARMQNIQAISGWHIARASLAQSIGQLGFSTLDPTLSKHP